MLEDMLSEAVTKNIVLYVMSGVFFVGLISRICLNVYYSKLQKGICNMANSKSRFLKQMKLKYENCIKLDMEIVNTTIFVRRNMCEYRVLGMSLRGIEKILGQAIFLDVLIGCTAICYVWKYKMGQDVIMLHSAVTMLFAAVLYNYDKLSDLGYKRRVAEINMVDFLENHLKSRLLSAREEETDIVEGEEYKKDIPVKSEQKEITDEGLIIEDVLKEFFG